MRFFRYSTMLRHETPSQSRSRNRPVRFIPRLEALEDRCLPSAVLVVILDPGTSWQLLGSPASASANVAEVPAAVPQANFSLTITYTDTAILSAQYVAVGSLVVANTAVFASLSNPSPAANPSVKQLNVSVSLFSSQLGFPSATTSYDLVLEAFDAANGVSFKITVANAEGPGKNLSGSIGLLHLQNPAVPAPDLGVPASAGDLIFSNSSAPAVVTISLPGISFPGTQPFTAVAGSDSGYAEFSVFAFAPNADTGIISANGFRVISYPFNSPGTAPPSHGRAVSSFNSLVLADSGPGLSLTLSIIHEASQRSGSPAAQATWTGLRPPLEAPLVKSGTPAVKFQAASDSERSEAAASGLRHPGDESNRPMEIMVANILQALQQAKAEDRVKESTQTAVRESPNLHFETPMADSPASALWSLEHDGEPIAFGNLLVPLNILLDARAPNDPATIKESSESEQSRPVDSESPASELEPASRFQWRALAETLVAVLMTLGCPGAFWVGTFRFLKPGRLAAPKPPPRKATVDGQQQSRRV